VAPSARRSRRFSKPKQFVRSFHHPKQSGPSALPSPRFGDIAELDRLHLICLLNAPGADSSAESPPPEKQSDYGSFFSIGHTHTTPHNNTSVDLNFSCGCECTFVNSKTCDYLLLNVALCVGAMLPPGAPSIAAEIWLMNYGGGMRELLPPYRRTCASFTQRG
jgi:hypothetical protein